MAHNTTYGRTTSHYHCPHLHRCGRDGGHEQRPFPRHVIICQPEVLLHDLHTTADRRSSVDCPVGAPTHHRVPATPWKGSW